jgi:hypothetical protein
MKKVNRRTKNKADGSWRKNSIATQKTETTVDGDSCVLRWRHDGLPLKNGDGTVNVYSSPKEAQAMRKRFFSPEAFEVVGILESIQRG